MSDSTDPTDISPLVTNPVVRELPPSCKLVWMILEREGETMRQDIRSATGMSRGQMEYSLTRLVDEEIIEKRPNPMNARQTLYSLCE